MLDRRGAEPREGQGSQQLARSRLSLAGILSAGRAGIEVGVDSADPQKLLGVRDGMVRFFERALERPLAVRVSSLGDGGDSSSIVLCDEEMIERATARVRALREGADGHPLVASSETGIQSQQVGERDVHFVRTWVVIGARDLHASVAIGGSGAIQLPDRLIEGLEVGDLPFAVPGRRRRGGMVGSLTGGVETRRSALALAALHAASTLFFNVVDRR